MTMMKFFALWLLFAAGFIPGAFASESAPFQTARDRVTLISSQDHVAPGGQIVIGLRFQTVPGWNIYWQNPGDAGQAPEVDLSLPPGANSAGISWPAPAKQPESGIMTYGYQGDVVLPMRVTAAASGDLAIKASAQWLICNNICVPEQHDFTLTIPAGNADVSAQAGLIDASLAKVPVASPFSASIAKDGTLKITGDGLSAAAVKDAWFFPEDFGPIDISAPEQFRVADGVVTLKLKPGAAFKPTQHLTGVLALDDPRGGVSNLAIDAAPAVAPAVARATIGLLLSAFIGGLILNLMPCVFPILAMKALALARMAGADRAEVRREAGYYTLGVVVSFAALGAVLALARALGGDQGWGFQFQSPLFVAAMAALMFAVGLNLLGVFEFSARFWMPRQGGKLGSFLTGLLAVLLATPCTAPFMAVAIAAALQAPALDAVALFVALGLGMASPYALLAAAPGLARWLPRPGAWMGWLRQALAVPMLAAMLWLVWVASEQLSRIGLVFVVILLMWLALGLLALRKYQHGGSGRMFAINAGVAALFMLLAADQIASHPAGAAVARADSFSAARLASLRAAGKPVFVDMTAAWCVTCLVNERVALQSSAVQSAFARNGVAYLKGDWTNQDPEITAYLRDHGRDGVPLYVFYPVKGAPVVLPQILSAGLVLDEVKAE